ncbi:MAG: sugar O-acetyltransferase [Bacteroidota bacterium]
MKSEKEKMLAGELYSPLDPELKAERKRARRLTRLFNETTEEEESKRAEILGALFGRMGAGCEIEPPFRCDYGGNISLGEGVFMNFGCIILDVCPVVLGNHVLVGPGVQFLAATHPLSPSVRSSGLESGAPITVGDRVWIGGGAILLPGVTIGEGSVIGAGSVVTRSIPPGVVAAGNPCRVIKELP